jgi:hypothetical protein
MASPELSHDELVAEATAMMTAYLTNRLSAR